MPHLPPDFPTSTATWIEGVQTAQVAAHIRAVLARFQSYMNQSNVKQMHKGLYEDWERPIRGLHLPLNAWKVLDRENITTLAQLVAIALRVERLPGIGAKTALAIQVELGRIALHDAQSR